MNLNIDPEWLKRKAGEEGDYGGLMACSPGIYQAMSEGGSMDELECPYCGFTGDVTSFDAGGMNADDHCCNRCNRVFATEVGRAMAALDRVRSLLDFWVAEMHRAKEEKRIFISPVETVIEEQIDQLQAAIDGKG